MPPQGIRPGLAAVLVGHVPASEIYVRSKVQTCADLGLFSELITPPETVTTEEMLDLVASLNDRDDIDGILIQLPLPEQVDAKALLDAVSPEKDVDGFHPVNAGRLQAGRPALAPCTPAGVIEILKRSEHPHRGPARRRRRPQRHRRQAGGHAAAARRTPPSPSATRRPATLAPSRARPTSSSPPSARPGFITPEMVKPGATIIDVGINRLTTREEFDRFFAGDAEARSGLRQARLNASSATCIPRPSKSPAPTPPCPAASVR